jgi:hypothetical protein
MVRKKYQCGTSKWLAACPSGTLIVLLNVPSCPDAPKIKNILVSINVKAVLDAG